MLGGELAVLQAPMFDGLAFDPFSLPDDGFSPAEVGIGGCDVAQALAVAAMVVMLDERLDLGLKVAGQQVVLQQDAVLEGPVLALDLALGPRAYAATGHGGNRELRSSEPVNLRFSILQLTTSDLEVGEVVALEDSWKQRLHTREFGLNRN